MPLQFAAHTATASHTPRHQVLYTRVVRRKKSDARADVITFRLRLYVLVSEVIRVGGGKVPAQAGSKLTRKQTQQHPTGVCGHPNVEHHQPCPEPDCTTPPSVRPQPPPSHLCAPPGWFCPATLTFAPLAPQLTTPPRPCRALAMPWCTALTGECGGSTGWLVPAAARGVVAAAVYRTRQRPSAAN